MEKPSLKKKNLISHQDQRTVPPPQQSSSVIASRIEDQNSTNRIGDSFLANCLDVLPSPTVLPLSLRPPCAFNLEVFHLYFTLFFSLTLSFSLMGFLSYFSLSLSLSLLSEDWKSESEMRVSLSLSLRLKTLFDWPILFFFFFGEIT